MSHVASLISVALLFASIALNIVSLSIPWWKAGVDSGDPTLTITDVSLWDVKFTTNSAGKVTNEKMSWDDMCGFPSTSGQVKGTCTVIKAMRAFLLLGAIFALFASGGNAAGIYTGNTLIDAGAGVVAAFSSIFSAVAIGLGYLAESQGITSSGGFLTACIACGLQLIGGFFGCVGTCQEMHELTKLAASLHLGEFKDPEPYVNRSARSAKIREADAADAQVVYDNLQKRKRAAEEALARHEDTKSEGSKSGGDEEDGKKKKVPVMLQRVLFRKPVEGDDDEIPTKMLEDAFAEIDGDGSGSIELEELVDALRMCGLAVSKTATDVVMREIDKNASGDVDLREFIEFFRHIEDLNRFQKKSAARQQFLSFLLNFCFLADIVVVGVMLMMFIRMKEADNPDNYAILKNVLMACSAFLGLLFLLVILIPILRMALGPTVNRMSQQYELAQEIKRQQKKPMDMESDNAGPREAGYGPDDPPPPVNAAMFGRSYRPGKVDSSAWTPAIEDLPTPPAKKGTAAEDNAVVVRASSHGTAGRATTASSDEGRMASRQSVAGSRQSVKHTSNRAWRYDPANYRIAIEHSQMLEQANLGPSGWAPMQMRDVNIPKQTAPAVLPGAPLALTDAAFPHAPDAR